MQLTRCSVGDHTDRSYVALPFVAGIVTDGVGAVEPIEPGAGVANSRSGGQARPGPRARDVGRQLIQIRVFGANDAPNAFSVIWQVATCAQQAKDFAIAA